MRAKTKRDLFLKLATLFLIWRTRGKCQNFHKWKATNQSLGMTSTKGGKENLEHFRPSLHSEPLETMTGLFLDLTDDTIIT